MPGHVTDANAWPVGGSTTSVIVRGPSTSSMPQSSVETSSAWPSVVAGPPKYALVQRTGRFSSAVGSGCSASVRKRFSSRIASYGTPAPAATPSISSR